MKREFISVFRSSKNADTYCYIRRGYDWSSLPEALRDVFGAPQHTMDLLLTPDKKLARATGAQVLEAIDRQDFFLQMPEKLDSYVVEFKEKLKRRSS